jgi:hypothetical protein
MKHRLLSLLLLLIVVPTLMAADGPRDGKYRILSYGRVGAPPLYLGYFVLAGGSYKAYLPGDRLSGEGKYTYHADSKSVTWDSGPYAGVWNGGLEIDRGGKTHKIRLKSTTIGTNSTDAP